MSTNMELIASKTATADGTSSITFSSIPQTYTDLKLVWTGRSSRNVFTATYTLVQFNGTTSGYTYTTHQGEGSGTPASQTQAGLTTDGIVIGGISNSNNTANTFGSNEMYIPNYTSSNYKFVSAEGSSEQNATGVLQVLTTGLWSNTAAITSITLKPWVGGYFDWVEGSTFYLYGISNVTSTTKATGGIVSSDGTYNYHMFPYSGTFTPTETITADVLVVAGGGAGGWPGGAGGTGGGGAGGLVYLSSQSLTATGYSVTIGAGGTVNTNEAGLNGSNSQFGSLTAAIGGGGGGRDNMNGNAPAASGNGKNGGSGGGGGVNGDNANTPVGGTGSQGGNGGNGYNGFGSGGGGGGAGGNGQTIPSRYVAGSGGVGLSTYLSLLAATQTGINGYIAGGGGGGAGHVKPALGGTGGLGGGGNGGGSNQTSSAGVVNTGGGGGGGGYNTTDGYTGFGKPGGSGIVIIRYAI